MPPFKFDYAGVQARDLQDLEFQVDRALAAYRERVQTIHANRALSDEGRRGQLEQAREGLERELAARETSAASLLDTARRRLDDREQAAQPTGNDRVAQGLEDAQAAPRVRELLAGGASIADVAKTARQAGDAAAFRVLRREVRWLASQPGSKVDLAQAIRAIETAETGTVPADLDAARRGRTEAEQAHERLRITVQAARAFLTGHASGTDSGLAAAVQRRMV
jgi:hypothetical protein